MIVRLMEEGQYEIGDAALSELNELDEQALRAIGEGDSEGLRSALTAMAQLVRENGSRLDDASLSGSDVVLPAADLTLDEARRVMSSDEGLIPDIDAA